MLKAAILGQLGFLACFLGLWELVARVGWADPELLPAFSAVVPVLWDLLGDTRFLENVWVTLVRIVVAFVITAPLAVSLGFLLGEKLHLGRILNPMIHFVLAVPQSIFLPVFILLFGIGFIEKIVFGMTHIFFVVVVNTVAAVRAVPKGQVLAARSFGATTGQIYAKVYLPAMLPLVVTGLRLGMIFNIIGILLAEMYATRSGVGLLIAEWGEAYEVRELMAGIVFISIGTIAINELMRLWEARVGRWQRVQMAS